MEPTKVAGAHHIARISPTEEAVHEFLQEIDDEMPPDSWKSIFLLGEYSGFSFLFTHPRIRIKTVFQIIEDVCTSYPFLVDASLVNFPIYPQEITDHIFLGSAASDDARVYEHLGISCVVNLTRSNRTQLKNVSQENFLHMDVEDDESQYMSDCWQKGLAFINRAVERKEKTFVHCQRGVSRSGSLVIGYIMLTQNCSYSEALEFVQRQRPHVRPNRGFETQLKEFIPWYRSRIQNIGA